MALPNYEQEYNKKSIITASIRENYTLQETSTYEKLSLNTGNALGNKLSMSNDGGILIGGGVSKVLVSTKAHFNTVVASTSLKWITVFDQQNNTVIMTPQNLSARGTIVSSATLIEVNEGDTLYLKVYGAAGDVIRSGIGYTNITIQVVE